MAEALIPICCENQSPLNSRCWSYRTAGSLERPNAKAADLASLKVDVMFAESTPAASPMTTSRCVQIGSLQTRPGRWANIPLIHDRVFDRLARRGREAAVGNQIELIDKVLELRSHSRKRLEVIEEPDRALAARG